MVRRLAPAPATVYSTGRRQVWIAVLLPAQQQVSPAGGRAAPARNGRHRRRRSRPARCGCPWRRSRRSAAAGCGYGLVHRQRCQQSSPPEAAEGPGRSVGHGAGLSLPGAGRAAGPPSHSARCRQPDLRQIDEQPHRASGGFQPQIGDGMARQLHRLVQRRAGPAEQFRLALLPVGVIGGGVDVGDALIARAAAAPGRSPARVSARAGAAVAASAPSAPGSSRVLVSTGGHWVRDFQRARRAS